MHRTARYGQDPRTIATVGRFSFSAANLNWICAGLALLGLAWLASVGPVSARVPEGATLSVTVDEQATPVIRSVTRDAVSGERFVAGELETLEILFSDGTSLILAPGTVLTVETYAYDRASGKGELVLRLDLGLVRVNGGVLNNTQPIEIVTPSAELSLNNGSAFVEVDADGRTSASLLFGRSLAMTSGGETKTLERPDFELVAVDKNAPPQGPNKLEPGSTTANLLRLNPGLLTGIAPGAGPEEDEAAEAGDESEEVSNLQALATFERTEGSALVPPGNGGIDFGGQPLDGSGGLGAGEGADAVNTVSNQPSDSASDARSSTQNRVGLAPSPLADPDNVDGVRDQGPTANRLFNSQEPFTQSIALGGEFPDGVSDASSQLQYVFLSSGIILLGDIEGEGESVSFVLSPDCCAGDWEVPFAFGSSTEQIFDTQVVSLEVEQLPLQDTSGDTRRPLIGSIFGDTDYLLLTAGFSAEKRVDFFGDEVDVVVRAPDNFFALEARPSDPESRNIEILRASFLGFDDLEEEAEQLFFLNQAIAEVEAAVGDLGEDAETEAILRLILDQGTTADTILLDPLIADNPDLLAFLQQVPNQNARFFFAAGDVDGFNPETLQFSVDHFFISAGLEGFGENGLPPGCVNLPCENVATVASSIRAFLREATALGVDLTDTGLIVVNQQGVQVNGQNALFHADFGLQGSGAEGDQQLSTISVTLGEIDYVDGGDGGGTFDAVVSGRTIASTSGSELGEASVLITSPLFSSAAGGGNPALDGSSRAGFFVLENIDPATGEGGSTEQPLDADTDSNSDTTAILRLATATSSETPADRNSSTLTGFVAGLGEAETESGVALVLLNGEGQEANLTIQTNADTNRVDARVTFGTNIIDLGGLDGLSAFIDDDRIAAMTAAGGSADVALVSGELLKEGLPDLPSLTVDQFAALTDDLEALGADPLTADQVAELSTQHSIRDYEHVQWGFFFGDTKTGEDREHLHLGTYAAGKVPEAADLALQGTATFTGHTIGNVFNNGSLYTAVGTFVNAWNFDQAVGTAKMRFDNASYTGPTNITSGVKFIGTLESDVVGRTGGLNGNIVLDGAANAVGEVGQFTIQGDTNETYRAAGTFAAD